MKNQLQVIFNETKKENKNKVIEEIVKKVSKIEKLKKDLDTLKNKINVIKEQFNKTTKDVLEEFKVCKENYILLLIDKYNLKSFTKWQKEYIEKFINDEIEILREKDLVSEELDKVYNTHMSKTMNNMSKSEKMLRDEMTRDMFENMGFEFEDNFDFDNIFKEDFSEKMKEKFQEEHFKYQEKSKEFEKQQQVENTDIDFQKLYKKLVKISHPDLAKSEFDKASSEITMKKLTTAWDDRNYYELIMIWMEIDPENTINLQINEKNQRNIVNQLNQKIKKTESELKIIKRFDPYSSFYYGFNAPKEITILKNINNYKEFLVDEIEETNFLLERYMTNENLKFDLKKIKEEEDEEEIDFFSFFNPNNRK